MSELKTVFKSIILENLNSISTSIVMQIVEEISSDMIEGIAEEFNIHYEEAESHMRHAMRKFEEKLKEDLTNGD